MADRPARRRSSLADEHPAYTGPPQTSASPAAPSPPDATGGSSEAPATLPPPRRRRAVRLQLNTRVRQDLHERLMTFVGEHDAAVQDVIEGALEEYLNRRATN